MTLKFKRNDEWEFIGDIDIAKTERTNNCTPDGQRNLAAVHLKKESGEQRILECGSGSGIEDIYLLNDRGQTIERLA
jgi:hypothetical protein